MTDLHDLQGLNDRPTTEPRTEAACPKCGHDVDHTTACPDGCPLCLTSPRTRLADRLREMYGPSLRPDDPDHDGSMADWLRDADALAEAAQGAAPRPAWEGYDTAEKALAAFFDWANNIAPTTEADWHHWWAKSFLNDPPLVSERAAPRAEGLDWRAESRRYDLLVVAANLMERWRDMPSDLFENEQAANVRLRRERDKWITDYHDHAAALSRPSDERVPPRDDAG